MEKVVSGAEVSRVARGLYVGAVAFVMALAVVVGSTSLTFAAPNPASHYPAITLNDPSTTATATFPGASNLVATVATGKNMNRVGGASTFLPATRGMGVVYGSSENFPYLSIEVDNTANTTATITLSREPAATRFAFAVGDIDAETLVITMTNASNTPLTAAEMGAQPVFNHKTTSGPVPAITAAGNAVTVEDTDCPASPAAGVTCDTDGATAWFQPTVAVKTITISSATKTGFPRYQLWMAHTDNQVVTWSPTTTSFDVADSPFTPDQLASVEFPTTGGGAISYAVEQYSTSNCQVNPTTAEITATTTGTCVVTATAQATSDFDEGSRTLTFSVTTPPPPSPSTQETPRRTPNNEPVVVVPGPELAATGAPPWPVWTGALLVAGLTLYSWARFVSRQPTRARNG